jgi:hypothetical protein
VKLKEEWSEAARQRLAQEVAQTMRLQLGR